MFSVVAGLPEAQAALQTAGTAGAAAPTTSTATSGRGRVSGYCQNIWL